MSGDVYRAALEALRDETITMSEYRNTRRRHYARVKGERCPAKNEQTMDQCQWRDGHFGPHNNALNDQIWGGNKTPCIRTLADERALAVLVEGAHP